MDDILSIYDFIETLASSAAVAVDAGWNEVPAATVAAASPDYLESGRKHCEKRDNNQSVKPDSIPDEQVEFEIARCGCRSRFCSGCCCGLGLSLKERLVPILETFTGLLMWTFTVDPTLFESPEAAFNYVRDHRCISNVMRELKRRRLVHSGRYFVVVEWQMGKEDEKGTEMAHWHLLADASFIPFQTVCDLWNRYRPPAAGPVEGNRPGFGSVRFSAPEFESALHAARYACKYMIKHPEKGYPAWVMDRGDVHRYSTSRGFWGNPPRSQEPEIEDRSEVDIEPDEIEPENRTTIRERLAKCGKESVLVKVSQCIDEATGEAIERRDFVCRLDAPLHQLATVLDLPWVEGTKRLTNLHQFNVIAISRFKLFRPVVNPSRLSIE